MMKHLLLIMALGLFALMAIAADTPEDGFWKSVKKSDVAEEYRLYVEQYPKGKYLGEAWRRIGQIEGEQKSAPAGRRVETEARRLGKVFKDCADCPEMAVIPAGRFQMGSIDFDNEMPIHNITIGNAFALGKTEITLRQWRAVMGNDNLSFAKICDDCAVQVTWTYAQEFLRKLSNKTGKTFRLPSEAEWEYACRADSRYEYCGSNDIDDVAWHAGNSRSNTNHTVAGKQPNEWGLYDMSGNVWEWLEDCKNLNYRGAPSDGSAWLSGDCSMHMQRGGASHVYTGFSRATGRYDSSSNLIGSGFRPARMLP